MNMMQMEQDLKDVPLPDLVKMVQTPTVPGSQMFALAEIQRRQQIMNGGAGAQAPTTTVAQDVLQGLQAPTGVQQPFQNQNRMPTSAPGQPPVAPNAMRPEQQTQQAGFASGGIVGLAGGGPAEGPSFWDALTSIPAAVGFNTPLSRKIRERNAQSLDVPSPDYARLEQSRQLADGFRRADPITTNMDIISKDKVWSPEQWREYLDTMSGAESGGKEDAKPFQPSNVKGKLTASKWYQITDGTRKSLDKMYGLDPNDRSRPMEARRAILLAQEAHRSLSSSGIPISFETTHGYHFGSSKYVKLVNLAKENPNANFKQLFTSDEINANPSILGNARTAAEAVRNIDGTMRHGRTTGSVAPHRSGFQAYADDSDPDQKVNEALGNAYDATSPGDEPLSLLDFMPRGDKSAPAAAQAGIASLQNSADGFVPPTPKFKPLPVQVMNRINPAAAAAIQQQQALSEDDRLNNQQYEMQKIIDAAAAGKYAGGGIVGYSKGGTAGQPRMFSDESGTHIMFAGKIYTYTPDGWVDQAGNVLPPALASMAANPPEGHVMQKPFFGEPLGAGASGDLTQFQHVMQKPPLSVLQNPYGGMPSADMSPFLGGGYPNTQQPQIAQAALPAAAAQPSPFGSMELGGHLKAPGFDLAQPVDDLNAIPMNKPKDPRTWVQWLSDEWNNEPPMISSKAKGNGPLVPDNHGSFDTGGPSPTLSGIGLARAIESGAGGFSKFYGDLRHQAWDNPWQDESPVGTAARYGLGAVAGLPEAFGGVTSNIASMMKSPFVPMQETADALGIHSVKPKGATPSAPKASKPVVPEGNSGVLGPVGDNGFRGPEAQLDDSPILPGYDDGGFGLTAPGNQAPGAQPPQYGGSQSDYVKQYLDSIKSDKDQDYWMTLAKFGAALAGGTSPYFAQNFGPAAGVGIDTMRDIQKGHGEDQKTLAELQYRQAVIDAENRRADNQNQTSRDVAQIGANSSKYATDASTAIEEKRYQSALDVARINADAKLSSIKQSGKVVSAQDVQKAVADAMKGYTFDGTPESFEIMKKMQLDLTTAFAQQYKILGLYSPLRGNPYDSGADESGGIDVRN